MRDRTGLNALPYVAVQIKEKVERRKIHLLPVKIGVDAKGNDRFRYDRKEVTVEEPGGYMVYFPRGHALRLTEKQMKRRGLKVSPKDVIPLSELVPSNSPLYDEAMRMNGEEATDAMRKKFVIMKATRKTGNQLVTKIAPPMELAEHVE